MKTNDDLDARGRSRRRMLGGLSAAAAGTAAAVAAPSVVLAQDGSAGPDRPGDGPGRFRRMFDGLEPFAPATDEVRAALVALGAPGGIMDGGAERGDVPENPVGTMPAGFTFLGQFIDHDLTRDAGSTLGQTTSLRRSVNLRSPRFDLDCVYGGGPADRPDLYAADDPWRLRIEDGGTFEDLPRTSDGTAVIADDRNDENLIVGQLQAAFLAFHDAVLDRVRQGGRSGRDAFVEARRLVRWHYQWIVVHEVLPAFVGGAMADAVLAGDVRTPFFAEDANRRAITVEFQVAAYRFGHSLVNPGYRVNTAGDDGEAFAAPIFDASLAPDHPDPDDLSGGRRAARRFVDWELFFDHGDGSVTPSRRLDTRLSGPLMNLPVRVVDAGRAEGPGPTSLATRNLLRHLTWSVPSGQAVASALGADVLDPGDLADLAPFGAGLQSSTPLFFYVLREADVVADGAHLGPVGGRIVAETFVELLRRDRGAYLAAQPDWTPTLPGAGGPGTFTIADLLAVAGVDPASRAAGVRVGSSPEPGATRSDVDDADPRPARPAGPRRGDDGPRPARRPR